MLNEHGKIGKMDFKEIALLLQRRLITTRIVAEGCPRHPEYRARNKPEISSYYADPKCVCWNVWACKKLLERLEIENPIPHIIGIHSSRFTPANLQNITER